MRIFTIGFTKKSARRFFEILRKSGARRVIDVRLNNVSQLTGFAKRDDLACFLAEICGMDYVHLPELAPTKQMLDDYKEHCGDWSTYEASFLDLMRARRVERTVARKIVADGCLLCSEHTPDRCHRRPRRGVSGSALGRPAGHPSREIGTKPRGDRIPERPVESPQPRAATRRSSTAHAL